MPPWHADPRYGHFANDRSLSAKERATLLAWVDQGTPLGDPKDMPPARKFPEGWTIGKPDMVFEIPEPITCRRRAWFLRLLPRADQLQGGHVDQAAEAVPGDRVGRPPHRRLHADQTSRRHAARGPQHFCGYAPGDMPSVLPEGRPSEFPPARTCCSRSTTRPTAGSDRPITGRA